MDFKRFARHWTELIQGRLQDGWERVKIAAWPNTQAALVATAAYAICHWGLHHTLPIFAPVACYLAMGFTRSRSPRRVLEMGLGATVGIGIGELFAHYAGFGIVSLAVVLLVAPLIGRLVDHSELLTYQAAMQSVIVVSMAATTVVTGPAALGRWFDALLGTVCALLFVIVHPNKPSETPLRRAQGALNALARAAATMARGIRECDDTLLQETWRRTRAARRQLAEGHEALRWAHQIAFVKWRRHADREVLDEVERIYNLTSRAASSIELAVRYGRGEIVAVGPSAPVADLYSRLSDILVALGVSVGKFNKPDYARRRAIELAKDLDPEDQPDQSWRSLVMVSLLRSTVMDVLQITGLSRLEAWGILPDPGMPEQEGVCPPEDEPSAVWGDKG
jgi:uncharacterized membrane protein YgaE (UPF0421/DUF939 family)